MLSAIMAKKQPSQPRRSPSESPKRTAPDRVASDETDAGGERLQKVLAAAGLGSRRHCEEYIVQGRVTIDGVVATELGIRVDPVRQKVQVDGERIQLASKEYFLLHKPPGYLCTNSDPGGRKRVFDLLPPGPARLFTVGRLDENSEGLLIVTNDGELAHRLAHPRFQIERLYHVHVAGVPSAEVLTQLKKGLFFTEGKFRIRDARVIKTQGSSAILEVTLTEGQNREVRRLFARVGHKVMRLRRVQFGPIRLGSLELGEYRPLSGRELKELTQLGVPHRPRVRQQHAPGGRPISTPGATSPAARKRTTKSAGKSAGPARRKSATGKAPSRPPRQNRGR